MSTATRRVRADFRSIVREAMLEEQRRDVLRASAENANARLLRARRALVEAAVDLHATHAHVHPHGVTWRECTSVTCERVRKSMLEVDDLDAAWAALDRKSLVQP